MELIPVPGLRAQFKGFGAPLHIWVSGTLWLRANILEAPSPNFLPSEGPTSALGLHHPQTPPDSQKEGLEAS